MRLVADNLRSARQLTLPLYAGPIGIAAMAVVLAPGPLPAQQVEAIARLAQAITVRLEGATQGSGVLVEREGNRYTVLTSWHVVSGQRPSEELDIYTADGQRHALEQGSIRPVAAVDLAVLSFISAIPYTTAAIGDPARVLIGSPVYVSGYPLPTSAVPLRLLRFVDGKIIARSTAAIPDGYQLVYSNPTLSGMSGGAVLDSQGKLVGIHGRGETDIRLTEQAGIAVRTGANLGVPVSFFKPPMPAGSSVSFPRLPSPLLPSPPLLSPSGSMMPGSDRESICAFRRSLGYDCRL